MIVGFEVSPCSIKRTPGKPVEHLICDSGDKLPPAQEVKEGEKIMYTYDVYWEKNDKIKWASRWDSYLRMPGGKVRRLWDCATAAVPFVGLPASSGCRTSSRAALKAQWWGVGLVIFYSAIVDIIAISSECVIPIDMSLWLSVCTLCLLFVVCVQVHWFSILNSLLIVLVMASLVAMILIRTIRRDLAKYEQLMVDSSADMKDEAGWKLLTGDVFRSPNKAKSLAVHVS